MSTPDQVNWFASADEVPSEPHVVTINGVRGVWLPSDFTATEAGNTLLEAPDDLRPNLVAWIELTETVRLELTLIARNSPALHIGIDTKPLTELETHVTTNLKGWLVHRCNLEHVDTEVDGNLIVIADTPED